MSLQFKNNYYEGNIIYTQLSWKFYQCRKAATFLIGPKDSAFLSLFLTSSFKLSNMHSTMQCQGLTKVLVCFIISVRVGSCYHVGYKAQSREID